MIISTIKFISLQPLDFCKLCVYLPYQNIKKTTTMKTTTKKIEESSQGNVTADFYYEWGDEPMGYVSTGTYIDEVFYFIGYISKEEAVNLNLKYHCPHS